MEIQFATFALAARAGLDYVTTNGTLTFGPGETSKPLTIEVPDDSIADGTKILGVALTSLSLAGVIGPQANAMVWVQDDEPVPAVCPAAVRPYFGPRPLGRFNALTTSVGKLVFVFENKASACRTLGLLSTLPSVGR